MAYALVTGASSGIGKEYARQLAGRGYDLVLVARDGQRLKQVGDSLVEEYGVSYEVLKADLTNEKDVLKVVKRIEVSEKPIEILVNNAGFGLNKAFHKSTEAEEKELLEILVTTPVRLTKAAVTKMLEHKKGYVINVGSVAAWMTTGTYSAAKSYLHSFSESLCAAYSKQGVYVSVVAPGFTKTEFHQRANISMQSVPKWLWLTDEFVVKKSLVGAFDKESLVVPGIQYKFLKFLVRVLPRAVIRAFSNSYRTRRKAN
jgi:uncharacterized protein